MVLALVGFIAYLRTGLVLYSFYNVVDRAEG